MKALINASVVARRAVCFGAAVIAIFVSNSFVSAADIGLQPNPLFESAGVRFVTAMNVSVSNGVCNGGQLPDVTFQTVGSPLIEIGSVRERPFDSLSTSVGSTLQTSAPGVSQAALGSLTANPIPIASDASSSLIPSLHLRDAGADSGANWAAYSVEGQAGEPNQWLYTGTLVASASLVTVLSLGTFVWILRGS